MRIAVFVALVMACSSNDGPPPEDASMADTRSDSATDAGSDVGPDTGMDAGPDPDAGVDAATDAEADAESDASIDAAPDAPIDAAVDARDAGLLGFGEGCSGPRREMCASGICRTYDDPPFCFFTACTAECETHDDCTDLLEDIGLREEGFCDDRFGHCDLTRLRLGDEACE